MSLAKMDMSRAIQDLALLYTQQHLEAKTHLDEQFNPYYSPQEAMDYLMDTYLEAVAYLSGKAEEYADGLKDSFQ